MSVGIVATCCKFRKWQFAAEIDPPKSIQADVTSIVSLFLTANPVVVRYAQAPGIQDKVETKLIISLIIVFFYVTGVISAINAVMTARTAQGAIAWTAALIAFPFVSVPAYWVFGRSKFEGFVEAYEENKDAIDALVEEARRSMQDDQINFDRPSPEYEAMRKLSGNSLLCGNRVELLIDGEATFDSILSGISTARDYVLVQFYMIHDDGLGKRLQEALIERAEAGVRTYLLYDEVGCGGLTQSYIHTLRDVGVEVSSFNPTRGFWNRFQLNFRNHRKIVIVDGTSGWVGGHNVGDEYIGLDEELSPWRDTHVRLDGPVVIQLQVVVAQDWYWATRKLPHLNWQSQAVDDSDVAAMIFPSAPTQRLETAGLMFVNALNAARERIWITAPYFVPDEAVLKALELAAFRGVDVRIIIPGQSDNKLALYAGYYYVRFLRDLDIRFYKYKSGFLHQKVGLVDHSSAWVGTANFDNRSFRLNFEVTALIADEDFAQRMELMFETDFANSEPLDPNELDERSFIWHLSTSIARLASPIL